GAVGSRQEAGAVFDGRRIGPQRYVARFHATHAPGPAPGVDPGSREENAAEPQHVAPSRFAIGLQKTKTEIRMSDRHLVLVRHGQSEWNLKNLFTGWKDPDLTEQGITEAKEAGRKLKAQGLKFDIAFTSVLKRARHRLDLILAEIGQTDLPVKEHMALNE